MVHFVGILFTAIIGTLGHYLYKLSSNNKLVGFLFAKDESLYSHLKLGFTPMLFWMIVENMKVLNNDNIIMIKGISFIIFTLVISIPYFISHKIYKKNITWLNISSFYLAIILSYITTFLLFNMIYLSYIIKYIGICSFILVIASYFIANMEIKKRVSTLS